MNNCGLCKTDPTLPYKLSCEHIFCFLCIKTFYTDGGMECPNCKQFITEDLNNVTLGKTVVQTEKKDYRWLYSSNFSNRWWCYDDSSNKQIERIYRYHTYRTQRSTVESEVPAFDISLKDTVRKPKIKTVAGSVPRFVNYAADHSQQEYEPSGSDITFDTVSFEESEVTEESLDSDDHQSDEILSNIVKIGSANYQIDFEENKQISVQDVRKKRSIKRLELPDDLEEDQIVDFLKQNKVVGISGMKFA